MTGRINIVYKVCKSKIDCMYKHGFRPKVAAFGEFNRLVAAAQLQPSRAPQLCKASLEGQQKPVPNPITIGYSHFSKTIDS